MTPARLLWGSAMTLTVGGCMFLCCTPKPTPAQSAQMAVVGVCEARVLVMIEKADTREALCKALADVIPSDVCSSFTIKTRARICP